MSMDVHGLLLLRHFTPCDGIPLQQSAMPSHSVVLMAPCAVGDLINKGGMMCVKCFLHV